MFKILYMVTIKNDDNTMAVGKTCGDYCCHSNTMVAVMLLYFGGQSIDGA